MDCFKIGKGICQGCILSPCLFNLYAESLIWNAGLDDSSWNQDCWEKYQYLGYADDATLMAESEEQLKNLLIRVKEENEKAGLNFSIQKTKILASSPITSWQIEGEKVETETDFIFLVSKITADSDCSQEIKRFKGRKLMKNLDS